MRAFLPGVVVIAGLLVGPSAADAYRVMGAGIDFCGKWTADRSSQRVVSTTEDEQWVLGYLSAIGPISKRGADPLNDVDAEAVWAWIDNYCRVNPLDPIYIAVTAFFAEHPR